MDKTQKKGLIVKIEAEARKYFVGASGCHDWTHVERVRNLAMRIGKKEKADPFVVEAAALLHDIGRKAEMKSKGIFCHGEEGAKTARIILEKIGLDGSDIENIAHCILTHRSRKANVPETLEAKVLFDADKLDSIGAVGVARLFVFAGNAGSNNLYTGNEKRLADDGKDYSYTKEDSALLEYYKKARHVYKKTLTREGKKIAGERHRFMRDYFTRFDKEIKSIF